MRERKKRSQNISAIKKRDLSICYLLKESASMLEQNKPKLRRFELRAFWDKMRSFCTISASTFWKIQPEDGNETLIFKRFRLFRSRLDSSDCESPSKCFLLSNFDIPAYYLAGFSKRLSTVTSPVSRIPPPTIPSQTFQSQALIKMATV